MSASSSDDEKVKFVLPSVADSFLVQWDENDSLNPQCFSKLRKWLIVECVCVGSLAVTFGSTVYGSTYAQIKKEFNCSQEVATLRLSLFVLGLSFGPIFVNPLSEFYGRRYIYIVSMFLFLIWNIPCVVAQNIETLLIARLFDGLAGSAFMSVAAGTVSDLFSPHEIQAPMLLFTLSPFLGPVLKPLLGGFINSYVSWRWTFYVMIIWTGLLSIVFVLGS